MSPQSLTLGTRRSKLARAQTTLVAAAISSVTKLPIEALKVHAMDPLGDRDKTTALYKLSDGTAAKSLWTGELEELLEKKELDLIVHSLKDMPTTLPSGLVLAAVLPREDARDVLVLRRAPGQGAAGEKFSAKRILDGLPKDSVIGTSSLRRIAQLRRNYPDFKFEVMRGNMETRLRKLDEPGEFKSGIEYAALILAAAGLVRIDLGYRIDAYFSGESEDGSLMHAVGQGAIGIECREDDESTRQILSQINDRQTWLAISAERSLMRALEGGCSVPIGVETSWKGDELILKANVVSVDGKTAVEAYASATLAAGTEDDAQAEELGVKIAQELKTKGAGVILDAINAERHAE